MDGATYVVYLSGDGIPKPFKHFATRARARAFADSQIKSESAVERAAIYKIVGISDAREAIAALQRGEGELVEAKCPTASEAEIQREWKIAVSRGPKAMLKFLGLDKRS